jgi:hypothetical protein
MPDILCYLINRNNFFEVLEVVRLNDVIKIVGIIIKKAPLPEDQRGL